MLGYFNMLYITEKEFFLVAGTGSSNVSDLNAFDFALIDAGVGDANVIRLSSILPPNFTQIEPRKPKPGAMLPMAYAKVMTEDVYKISLMGAIVGVGIPKDQDKPGLIMEHTVSNVISFKEVPLTSDLPEDAMHVVGYEDRAAKWKTKMENHVTDMVEEGMRFRGNEIDYIITKCAIKEIKKNERYGAAFAGVVLV
jgi:arginine decarboxylase